MTESITVHNQTFSPYFTDSQIAEKVAQIGTLLNQRYAEQWQQNELPVLFLITLSGALFFGVDLVRSVDFVPQVAFVKCSSYGCSMTSSNNVLMQLEPTIDIKGRDIVIVEDIVDTGNTYQKLHQFLLHGGAHSVSIASFLYKSSVYRGTLPIDFYGFDIENIFVIGYGLDYNEQGRTLKHIYRLKQ